MTKLRKEGWIVLRTAGSHGFADLIAIRKPFRYPDGHEERGYIMFIQVKSGKSAEREREKAAAEIAEFTGTYRVAAVVE